MRVADEIRCGAAQANMRAPALKRFYKEAESPRSTAVWRCSSTDASRARPPSAARRARARARRADRRGMGGAGRDDRAHHDAADAARQFGASTASPRRSPRPARKSPTMPAPISSAIAPTEPEATRRAAGGGVRSRARLGATRRSARASSLAGGVMHVDQPRAALQRVGAALGAISTSRSRSPRCTR